MSLLERYLRSDTHDWSVWREMMMLESPGVLTRGAKRSYGHGMGENGKTYWRHRNDERNSPDSRTRAKRVVHKAYDRGGQDPIGVSFADGDGSLDGAPRSDGSDDGGAGIFPDSTGEI